MSNKKEVLINECIYLCDLIEKKTNERLKAACEVRKVTSQAVEFLISTKDYEREQFNDLSSSEIKEFLLKFIGQKLIEMKVEKNELPEIK